MPRHESDPHLTRYLASILIFGWISLGSATAVTTGGNDKFNKTVTIEEWNRVLKMKFEAVPEYEIVQILWPKHRKRSRRSAIDAVPLSINAFNRTVDFYLTPSYGIIDGKNSPAYYISSNKTSDDGPRIKKICKVNDGITRIMEDPNKMASFAVTTFPNGTKSITGFVRSQGWIIISFPIYDRSQVPDKWGLEHGNSTTGDSAPTYLIIYNSHTQNNATYASLPIPENIPKNRVKRSNRNVPAIIYPQILVFVDHEMYKFHDEDLDRLLEYLLAFWNGVDMIYRTLNKPQVRFNIAGILVAQDFNALPFISKNMNSTNVVKGEAALQSFAQYMPTVKSDFPLDNYDIAVGMTRYGMCESIDNSCDSPIIGLSWIEGACFVSETTTIMESFSTAIVQDVGSYEGLESAAHELGHLFGATHDFDNGTACFSVENNIMAAHTCTSMDDAPIWSKDTRRTFKKFFRSRKAKCLYDQPEMTSPFVRAFPEPILTADQQCDKIQGNSSCGIEDNVCMALECLSSSMICERSGFGAANGTPCGNGKFCFQGRCVFEEHLMC